MTTCTIKRCDAEATVRVILDRPDTEASRSNHAWTGHHEFAYCAEHAVDRVTTSGIEEYRDTITLTPLQPEKAPLDRAPRG